MLLACAICALTATWAAGGARALFLPGGGFAGNGMGDGQSIQPLGVAVWQAPGIVYVADSGNARVDLFTNSGKFIAAFGWGVIDGSARSETCTSGCRPGLSGSGPGQFSRPTSVAVDNATGDVYVADQGNNVVSKFNFGGGFLSTIDGAATPQKFSSLAGVAVDQSGNLWTADSSTGNVDEFGPTGKFLQQWAAGQPSAIAVDSTNAAVYVISNHTTTRFSLTGTGATTIDSSTGTALALDPKTGNLFVDHGGDAALYDKTGAETDTFALTPTTNSQGLAYGSQAARLYVSQVANSVGAVDDVTIFARPPTPAVPLVQGESVTNITSSGATASAQMFPAGLDTSCQVQFVDDPTFRASNYRSAQSVTCTPADLGSSAVAFQSPTAVLTSLNSGTVYHFRFVGTNSAGTTNGDDNTFETQGPPVVASESATSVADSTAQLNARVNPTGLDTTCSFQYVDNATFQVTGYNNAKSAPCTPSDLGTGVVQGQPTFFPTGTSASLTGLAPATTYHFRVVASNSAGTTNGSDETLKTRLSFLVPAGSIGSSGTDDGQFQAPVGVAANSSAVFFADSGNARVEKFDTAGSFVSAWGWGVSDGKSQSEVCTTNCEAGIPGPGGGEFKAPTGIAVGGGKVYVGDPGTNQVDVFSTAGAFQTVISGATTPQGHFQGLAGVSVDQSGDLWTADKTTSNIDEFNSSGKFLQQWSDTVGSPAAIAVDSTNAAVYLINGGSTWRFTLAGANPTTVDSPTTGSGVALALDPSSGNLYVDHGGDIAIYDHTGTPIDNLFSIGSTTNSQGLAYRAAGGSGSRLYVSDAIDNNISLFGPRAAGRPFITNLSSSLTGASTARLNAVFVPLGHVTTCSFQFVDDATFQASGYSSAQSVPCTQTILPAGFTYAEATASLTGLMVGTTYHYRVVATNSAGTTTGGDQTFIHGEPSGLYARFTGCPLADPPFSAAGNAGNALCVWAQTTGGRVTIGHKSVPIVNPISLQGGDILNFSTGTETESWVNALPGSLTLADPGQPVPGGLDGNPSDTSPGNSLTAVTQLVGPIQISTVNVQNQQGTAFQLPVKFHLINPTLGPSCFFGSDSDPIVLNLTTGTTNPPGPNMPITGKVGVIDAFDQFNLVTLDGQSLVDNTFSVPAATGCGASGSLDAAVDAIVGLPSASGSNTAILDGSSAIATPTSVLATITG